MDKFVIRKSGSQKVKRVNVDNHDLSESETDLQPPKKVSTGVSATFSSSSSKMHTYKSNFLYDLS